MPLHDEYLARWLALEALPRFALSGGRVQRPALTYAFRVRGARSAHVEPVAARASEVRHSVHGSPSRSVAIYVLATRTALLPGVDVCLDLPKCSVGVGLAYSLATWSRNDRP